MATKDRLLSDEDTRGKSDVKHLGSEKIVVIWRFGYFRLFNRHGYVENNKYQSIGSIDGAFEEYKRILWRLYWRVS